MTQSTSEALAKMGIDGQKMSQDLSAGTITIFDALQTVAQAIEGTSSSSKEAGEVMQQVFGRQGSMAGTKLGEAIATLNTNLEETKKQTGEVGESLDNLVTANERLNTELMKTFGYDGWNAMANEIKANLIVALADTVEGARRVRDVFVAVNAVVSPLSAAMKAFLNKGIYMLLYFLLFVQLFRRRRGVGGFVAASACFSGWSHFRSTDLRSFGGRRLGLVAPVIFCRQEEHILGLEA